MNNQMDSWLGTRKRILVLNREDMISKYPTIDWNAWPNYYGRQDTKVRQLQMVYNHILFVHFILLL